MSLHLEKIIEQKRYERPQFALRRHPIVFVKHIFIFLFLAGLPYVFFKVIVITYPWILIGPVAYPILVLGASTYYLWIWLYLFGQFIDYYLDLWVVTNDRVINIEQLGLFARTVAELDLFKVQDATSEVKGIISTFFNYGDVHVQTAGEETRFWFRQIPHPHKVRKEIIDLVEKDRKYHAKEANPTGL